MKKNDGTRATSPNGIVDPGYRVITDFTGAPARALSGSPLLLPSSGGAAGELKISAALETRSPEPRTRFSLSRLERAASLSGLSLARTQSGRGGRDFFDRTQRSSPYSGWKIVYGSTEPGNTSAPSGQWLDRSSQRSAAIGRRLLVGEEVNVEPDEVAAEVEGRAGRHHSPRLPARRETTDFARVPARS